MSTLPLLRLISDYIAEHARATPQKLCLHHDGVDMTYAQVNQAIDDCAKAYLKQGVSHGDRVAYFGNPTPQFLISLMAASSIGAIWMGLNPKYKQNELAYVVSDATPKFIWAQAMASGTDRTQDIESLAASVEASLHVMGCDNTLTDDFANLCDQGREVTDRQLLEARQKVETRHAAFLVYTSGSTGKPKGALLSHYGANFTGIIAVARKGLAGASIICNLPINHVGAISDICIRTMIGGGTIYFQETFDPNAMMEMIAAKKISVWGGVPTIFQVAASSPLFQTIDLSCVEMIAWGGARMPIELLETLIDKTGATQFTSGYGMTEMVGGVTYSRSEDGLEILCNTIGTPDPRQPIRLWNADGRPALPGEEGEIQVFGDFVMEGYLNKPEATAAAFTEDGWMRTGDVAIVRSDGNLELVGRMSEMYKSGGYNVYPKEIELALEELDGVALAAIVSVPDPVFQEVGHAFVMANQGGIIDEGSLLVSLKQSLANYKVPKKISVLASLPMLPVGKVDKVALKGIAMKSAGNS